MYLGYADKPGYRALWSNHCHYGDMVTRRDCLLDSHLILCYIASSVATLAIHLFTHSFGQ